MLTHIKLSFFSVLMLLCTPSFLCLHTTTEESDVQFLNVTSLAADYRNLQERPLIENVEQNNISSDAHMPYIILDTERNMQEVAVEENAFIDDKNNDEDSFVLSDLEAESLRVAANEDQQVEEINEYNNEIMRSLAVNTEDYEDLENLPENGYDEIDFEGGSFRLLDTESEEDNNVEAVKRGLLTKMRHNSEEQFYYPSEVVNARRLSKRRKYDQYVYEAPMSKKQPVMTVPVSSGSHGRGHRRQRGGKQVAYVPMQKKVAVPVQKKVAVPVQKKVPAPMPQKVPPPMTKAASVPVAHKMPMPMPQKAPMPMQKVPVQPTKHVSAPMAPSKSSYGYY